MRKDLLLLAIEAILKYPESFHYGVFVGPGWCGAPLSCNTLACVAGRATTVPEIAARGLFIDPGTGKVQLKRANGFVELDPATAIASVFELNTGEALYLFFPYRRSLPASGLRHSPGWNATAQEVAAHFHRFIAWKEQQK